MDLQLICEHLTYYSNCFNSISISSTLTQAVQLLNGAQPQAVIIPLGSTAEKSSSLNISNQKITESFSVITSIYQNTREGAGASIHGFSEIQKQLYAAFVGWKTNKLATRPIYSANPPWQVVDDQNGAKAYFAFNFEEESLLNSQNNGWDSNIFRIENTAITANTITLNAAWINNANTSNVIQEFSSYYVQNSASVVTPAS